MKEEKQEMNKLCRRCIRYCKQSQEILLLSCPRYMQRPFVAEELKFRQLGLFEDK